MIVDEAYVFDAEVDRARWPFTLAPVRHLARDGLAFPSPVTFLVCENSSGRASSCAPRPRSASSTS